MKPQEQIFFTLGLPKGLLLRVTKAISDGSSGSRHPPTPDANLQPMRKDPNQHLRTAQRTRDRARLPPASRHTC